MKETEKALDILDAMTTNSIRKNVVGTIFMGIGMTAFLVGLVIVTTKIDVVRQS